MNTQEPNGIEMLEFPRRYFFKGSGVNHLS
jgi:hypothetical protein